MYIKFDRGLLAKDEMRAAIRLVYAETRRTAVLCLCVVVPLAVCWWWAWVQFRTAVGFGLAVGASAAAVHLIYTLLYRIPHGFVRFALKMQDEVGPVTFVLDDEGILEKAETARAHHQWSAVEKWREDRDGIALYFKGSVNTWIPKRLLREEELGELQAKLANR